MTMIQCPICSGHTPPSGECFLCHNQRVIQDRRKSAAEPSAIAKAWACKLWSDCKPSKERTAWKLDELGLAEAVTIADLFAAISATTDVDLRRELERRLSDLIGQWLRRREQGQA